MRIGVNVLGLPPGSGGEEVYLRQVLRRAVELQSASSFVLFTDQANHDNYSGFERVQYDRGPVSREASGRIAVAMAENAGMDALFTSLRAHPGKARMPVVLYALDLLHWEQMPQKRSLFRANPLKKATEACMASNAVVVPSEYLKKRLLELLDIPLDKVVVAPLGVDPVLASRNGALSRSRTSSWSVPPGPTRTSRGSCRPTRRSTTSFPTAWSS